MGSKFRGVKQVGVGKPLTPDEHDEAVTQALKQGGKDLTDLPDSAEETVEVEPVILTDTVYTFAKLADSRHYRLVKIDFNPATGDAKVVGIQETEHQASGHVHEGSQYGLKVMFDRKTKGSVYDNK